MRLIYNLSAAVLLAIGISSCFKAPEFPNEPSITFNKVEFSDIANPAKADTLIITINFKDGNGDLGLSNSEEDGDTNYPYNDKFYFRQSDGAIGYFRAGDAVSNGAGRFFVFENGNQIAYQGVPLISYKTKRLADIAHTAYDTLPEFVTPYKCTNWDIIVNELGVTIDTLYFRLNPNQNNIFVDIYVQQPDQSFELFDWATAFPDNCQVNGINGRFPILSHDLSQAAAQEGKIRYALPSIGWNILFSIKYLQLHIYIKDRALNASNVVITEKFQLKGI